MIDLTSKIPLKLFADGADKEQMLAMYARPSIQGLTTNPTLMKKAGVTDYRAFCQEILLTIRDKPLSIEVFADDFSEMKRQALEIASWGSNVFVKIPVTNTRRESTANLVNELSDAGIRLNITAVMTLNQVRDIVAALVPGVPSFISIFAGRIADTGRDPVPLMEEALEIMRKRPECELIWASPRELLNIFQAGAIGCHAITATNDILQKLNLLGLDLDEYSLETVRMFHRDAVTAGYSL
ncbi:transaldolase [Polynucleobacter rarus]|uniref:transaldolase n=1 Tax=Polynucleobacter rarus TaxID=556055 RepID=UPI000D3E51F4|nr:transaldolase [Polynucleobacter rarus]